MPTLPKPETGWSRTAQVIDRALVCPPAESGLVQDCGVFGPQGWLPASATWRGGRQLMTAPPERPEPAEGIEGEHIWCGLLWAHFGHFLCESLSRLWALEQGRPQSLIFIPKRPGRNMIQGYHARILGALGIDLPIRMIRQPAEVERLIVPGQGFGLGEIARATPEFRDFMHRKLLPEVKPEGPEKLYISRSALTGRKGSVLLEDMVEKHLAAEGYEIFHPEQHPIEVQVARYRAARKVVGLDGSAFHLFGFTARPDQQVAVILRRNTRIYRSIVWQFEGFTGSSPGVVSAVAADWVAKGATRAGRSSFGELDVVGVGRGLAELGFVNRPRRWKPASPEELQAAVAQFEANAGFALERRAIVTRLDPAADVSGAPPDADEAQDDADGEDTADGAEERALETAPRRRRRRFA